MSSAGDGIPPLGEGILYLVVVTSIANLCVETLKSRHHSVALKGALKTLEQTFDVLQVIGLELYLKVGDGVNMVLENVLEVDVNGEAYTCVVGKSDFDQSLSATHFAHAIVEAQFLKSGMVVWNELKRTYSFDFFPKVLYRKMQHFMKRGVVMQYGGACMDKDNGKITCEAQKNIFQISAAVDTSKGFSTEFRANAAVMQQVMDLLFSKNNTGLQFRTSCKMEVVYIGDNRSIYNFECSTYDKTCITRCGRFVGDSLEESDGFCGPDNGPGCSSCMQDQLRMGDRWEIQVEVYTDMELLHPSQIAYTNVFIGMKKIPSPVKRVREPERESVCVICMDKAHTHIAVPCGHKCLCQECVDKSPSHALRTCPSCRENVRQWIKVYEC